MIDKTLNFTRRSLAEALDNVRHLSDLGPEMIAEQVFAASAQQPAPAVPDGWRDVLDRARESIGAGSLQENANTERQHVEPYLDGIYDELEALENGAAPAAPVAQEPVAWLKQDGSDAWTDAKKRLAAAHAGLPGAIIAEMYSLPLYAAPPAAEQLDIVAVPRDLLERLAGSPAMDPDCCVAYYRNELRALLGGGEK